MCLQAHDVLNCAAEVEPAEQCSALANCSEHATDAENKTAEPGHNDCIEESWHSACVKMACKEPLKYREL